MSGTTDQLFAEIESATNERSVLDKKKYDCLTAGGEDLTPAEFIRYGELQERLRWLHSELDRALA